MSSRSRFHRTVIGPLAVGTALIAVPRSPRRQRTPPPHSLTRAQHERGHVLCGGLAVGPADRWHTVRGPRGRN
jgi:hypothetical protein